MFLIIGDIQSITLECPYRDISNQSRFNDRSSVWDSLSNCYLSRRPCFDAPDETFGKSGILSGHIYGDMPIVNAEADNSGLFDQMVSHWLTNGTAFLQNLNGSYALMLYHAETEALLVSTDRFATYPLWHCNLKNGGMAISSDFHSLSYLLDGTIDYASLWSYMTHARPIGQRSFYTEIRAIRPGTALIFKNGKLIQEAEWYKPRFEPEHNRSYAYWGKELSGRLEAAMFDQMKGAVGPGLLLSGGIDSRLLASLAPGNTRCVTLADFNNREMKTAAKIARICGLKHVPVIRNTDWYPDLLEYSIDNSIGLWHWHHMHFTPLQSLSGDLKTIDRVMLGMGFDTFFKGNQISFPELWQKDMARLSTDEAVSFLLNFGTIRLLKNKHIESIMNPEVVLLCKDAYRGALLEEINHVLSMSNCFPDIWDMIQFRSIWRVPYFTNLTCLRAFVPTRNIVFDNRLYDLYFRIPAKMRRSGNVVRSAVSSRNLHLSVLLDGNSWLPVFLPSSIHDFARKTRRGLSAVRNKWYRMSGSMDFKSHGSWPQVGRLWIHNSKMHKIMDDWVGEIDNLYPNMFDIKKVKEMWQNHQNGVSDCSDAIDAIAGLGILKKQRSRAK